MEAGASCSDQNGPRPELRTLEDALETFGLLPRLQELDDSLAEVMRQRRTPEQHEAECRRLDKELVRLSRDHHPDRVKMRGGSREDIERTMVLQTALNATRTVLRTLTKLFLEDVDVDCRYGLFSKLDIGLLADEDSAERIVDDVLLKTSLASDIKREKVIPEVRRFLEASRRCVQNYLDGDYDGFWKDRRSALDHLEESTRGNGKLLAELEDVESECISEQLHSAVRIVSVMKSNCRDRLERLETLLSLSKGCGDFHRRVSPVPRNLLYLDDYLALPVACYVITILACSMTANDIICRTNSPTLLLEYLPSPYRTMLILFTAFSFRFRNKFIVDPLEGIRDRYGIRHLLQLASAYCRTKVHRVTERLRTEALFRATLEEVRVNLEVEFRVDDYSVVGGCSRKRTAEELKECRETLAELKNKVKEMESTIERNRRDAECLTKQCEVLKNDQGRVGDDLDACRANSKKLQEFLEEYKRESEDDDCLQECGLKKKVDWSGELPDFDESEESTERETDLMARRLCSLLDKSKEMVERCTQKMDRTESSSSSDEIKGSFEKYESEIAEGRSHRDKRKETIESCKQPQ